MSMLSRCVLLLSIRAHSLSKMSLALVQSKKFRYRFAQRACYNAINSFFCRGCACAGRTGHIRDPSEMPSWQ